MGTEIYGTRWRDDASDKRAAGRAVAQLAYPIDARSLVWPIAGLLTRMRRWLPHPVQRADGSGHELSSCYNEFDPWASQPITCSPALETRIDPLVIELAGRALRAREAVTLADLLAEFAIDVQLLRALAVEDEDQLVLPLIDRHPITYLYAHAVADLAGVRMRDNDALAADYEAAYDWCAHVALAQ